MKKILLLIAVSSSVMIAKAQIQYGIKGGLNVSTVGGNDTEGSKAKLGFHVGGFAEATIASVSPNFSIRPELVLSGQGAKYNEEGGNGTVNTYYINIPVMAKYTFSESFFAETGPQAGLLVSAKSKHDGNSQDIKETYKKTDFSWAIGVGYLSKSNIGVNARYNFGLSKVDKEGEFKAYNRVFQVGVFYVLGNTATR